MKNPEELIGKKVYGFEYKTLHFDELREYVGQIGVIDTYYKNNNMFVVKFEHALVYYPADKIEAHLVENKIPTFTKEDLRNAYKAGFSIVYTNKEIDEYFEKWYKKTYKPTKEEQLTAILGSSEKVSEIMELFKN